MRWEQKEYREGPTLGILCQEYAESKQACQVSSTPPVGQPEGWWDGDTGVFQISILDTPVQSSFGFLLLR